jgi:hypothetical protein
MEARVVKFCVTFLFCFSLALHNDIFSHFGILPLNHGHPGHEEVPEEPHEILEEESPVAVCSSRALVLAGSDDACEAKTSAKISYDCLLNDLGIMMTSCVLNIEVMRAFKTIIECFYFKPSIKRFWRSYFTI